MPEFEQRLKDISKKLKYDKAEQARPKLVDVDANLNTLMHMSDGNKSRKKESIVLVRYIKGA